MTMRLADRLKALLELPPSAPVETAEQRVERIRASIKKRFDEAVASGKRFVYLEFLWNEEESKVFATEVVRLANECETLESLQFVHLSGFWSEASVESDEDDFALLTFKRP